ncbi:CU044_5270 family protein [Nonomuraea terrae]|uniref:CU044_5270 family protein n=1 Tax=Nonomuraea terrae TaxID=2530383 RepID=UPI001FE7280F|nr:CU044_5270 family protein [Nonomuraea terrae]
MERLRNFRDEVPERLDVSGAGRKLAELTAATSGRRRAGTFAGASGRQRPWTPAGAFGRRRDRTFAGAAAPGRAAPRRRRPAYRLGLALAGAGVVAVAAVAVLRPQGVVVPDGPAGPPPAAASPAVATVVLERAALVAARSPATEIRPDQWFYLKESQHMGADLPTFETWDRMDGARTAIRSEGGRLRVRAAEKGPTHSGRTQREVAALPSDPDALLRHFRGLRQARYPLSICQPRCAPEIADDVKMFGAIGWYMKYAPLMPPETAAGMYRALARIPNVSIEENATDADGRRGIGVRFDAGDGVHASYILDPVDYRYMGVKVVSDGETMGLSVLGSGIVDKPGDLP